MIRELAKKLVAFVEFADFVITEITLRRGSFEASAQVVKKFSSAALLRASSSDAELLIKMIRPRKKITTTSDRQVTEKFWRTFTAAEVFEFAAAVGDKNQIHQLALPIVPGLLILETICAEFSSNQTIKLRFKNFIMAGEPLTLRVVGDKFEIICAEVVKVAGEIL